MARVIHTGDTHLGYRQYHRPERRADFLEAFRQVVEDAVEAEVDAVVHAGDLFHDRRPELEDVLGALSALRELDDAGIPFLAVVGNHETKREAQWLDLFASLGLARRLGAEPVVVGNVAFYGMDFVPRSQRDDLDYEFVPYDAHSDADADVDANADLDADDSTDTVPETDAAALVAHGQFAPLAPDYGGATDPWDARAVLEAATVDFDAMLLGDEHTPGREQLDDGTWITYPGSTERVSADERADRGYNIVEFASTGDDAREEDARADDARAADEEDRRGDDTGSVHITRRGLPTREFVYVDVELAENEGVNRVTERIGQYDLEDSVVVVTIEGAGDPVAPAHVEEQVSEAGALVARVTDRRDAVSEDDIDVSFADPDEAVRERVRELGLSPAARDLDGTIRESDIAKTKVADTVEERVREAVETGEESVFEPAPDLQEGEDGTAASAEAGQSGEAAEAERADAEDAEGQASTEEVEGQASMEEYL